MARPGIEPETSDLRVRCSTDCGMRPGLKFGVSKNKKPHKSHLFICDVYVTYMYQTEVVSMDLEKNFRVA